MIRSNVDLPQPEGPTMVTISRSSIRRDMSSNATALPYRRLIFSRRMADIALIRISYFMAVANSFLSEPIVRYQYKLQETSRRDRLESDIVFLTVIQSRTW